MRRIYLEVSSDDTDRYTFVQQTEDGYFVEARSFTQEEFKTVGPYPTERRALKAALYWIDSGRFLPLRP